MKDREREKQAPRREPNAGLDPRTPGPCPGPKAGAKLLSQPGILNFWLSNRNMVYWILPKCHSLAQTGKTISCTFIRVQGNTLKKLKGGLPLTISCRYMLSNKEENQYLLQSPLTFLHSVFCPWPQPSLWTLCERELSCQEHHLLFLVGGPYRL